MVGRNNQIFAVIKPPGHSDYALLRYDLTAECITNEAKITLPHARCSEVCLGLGTKGVLYLATEFSDEPNNQVSVV